MKVLHTSDIHIGSEPLPCSVGPAPSHVGLARVCSLAVRARVQLLVIAGDMFDSSRVPDEAVAQAARQLQETSVPTVILPGNHDCLVAGSPYLRPGMFQSARNISVIRDPYGQTLHFPELDLAIWGRPHMDYDDFSPLEGVPPRGKERWQVAVAHGHYLRPGDGKGPSWEISDADLERAGRDYIALGHLETFSLVGNNGAIAFYSGSPQRAGTAALVELDAGNGVRVDQVALPPHPG